MVRGFKNMINMRLKKIGLFSLKKRRQKEEVTTGFEYEGPLQWTATNFFPG